MNKFTILYKSGGGGDILIVDKYWKIITHLFNKMSENIYSDEIEHFHIELRVDGDYLSFGDLKGCNSLKL